jgi:hypothetical protein
MLPKMYADLALKLSKLRLNNLTKQTNFSVESLDEAQIKPIDDSKQAVASAMTG